MGGSDWISFSSTALANFATQYNFQSIAITLLIMSASVCTSNDDNCKEGQQKAWVAGTVQAVIFIGAVVGQLSMGFLGDYLSRNTALATTLAVSAFAALLSAVASEGSASSTYGLIIVFRFIMGIGLGGIYPLSATKSSEDSASSNTTTNAYGSACAFFWQIPGSVAPWLLAYIFSFTTLSTGFRWRLVLGLGAIPAAMAIVCLLIEDYQKKGQLVADSSCKASASSTPTEKPAITMEVIMLNLRDPVVRDKLIGCGASWFVYDIVYYGLTLLGGYVISEISDSDDDVSSDASIRNLCSKQSIALALGAVGIFASILLLPYLSLKYLQLWGFILQGFLLTMFTCFFQYLKENSKNGLFALYCLTLMSLQFGVPVTTYAMPAAVFEKDIRCTFNGIASAMGKLGAILGAYTFYYIAQASLTGVLTCCVVSCAVGAAVTVFCIDDASLMNDDSSGKFSAPSSSGKGLSRHTSATTGKSNYSNRGEDVFSPFPENIITTQLSFNAVDIE